MAIPANAMYETTAVQEYLATAANNYYRVPAYDEPADGVEEPDNKTKYNKSFKANNLAEAAKNENKNAFTQKPANNVTTNQEKVAFV